MPVRGRFAPSPSGPLHLGNARTALLAWLSTRSRGGTFVMRVEDLDAARTVPEAVAGNLEELAWLGLDWDEGPDVGGAVGPYLQSQRERHYLDALEALQRSGRVFACYLSRRDLRDLASAPHGRAPAYGPRERAANAGQQARKLAEGKVPSLRLKAERETLAFVDLVAGPQRAEASRDVGDIVLRRADGVWAYQLAVVVDDMAMGITEVVRGDDLLASTAAQLVLYNALGSAAPSFGHVPLLFDRDGGRMAKRKGSLTLPALREAGVEPEQLVGWLAWTIGLQPDPIPRTPVSLIEGYAPERLLRQPYTLSERDLSLLGVAAPATPKPG